MIPLRRSASLLLLFLCLTASLPALQAQPAMLQRAREGTFAPTAALHWWSVEGDQARQIAIPVTFLYPVNEQLQLTLATGPAFSTLVSGESMSLNGLSDTRFGGTYLFQDDKLLATFGVSLPSGKHALEGDEFYVANVLALHAFDFTTPILGQGLDFSAGIASAWPLSRLVVGAGAGFLLRGAFEPIVKATDKYNPGEEFTINLAVDYPLRQQRKLMADVNYTIYTADKIGATSVFQAGNRLTLQAMAWFPGETTGLLLMVRDRIRAKNSLASGEELIPERQNSNVNELELMAMVSLRRGVKTTWRGVVEGKLYGNNAYDLGGATVGGAGIGISRELSPALSLELDSRFYTGSLETGYDPAHLLGVKVSGGVKVKL